MKSPYKEEPGVIPFLIIGALFFLINPGKTQVVGLLLLKGRPSAFVGPR